MTSALEATMAVRAKFYVAERTQTTSGDRVVLQAVCRGEDNKQWSKFTPMGRIELSILNDAAVEQFIVGEEMYVDFTPAPKGQEG